jgi:exosome complex component RRP4
MTDTLKVKEKEVVVPGEVIAAGMGYLPGFGTYREGDEIKAAKLGLIHLDSKVVKIVPLSGRYFPRIGDVIIGKVFDLLMTGWRVDTNSAFQAVLPLRDSGTGYIPRGADLSQYYGVGDYVVAKVSNVTSQMLVDLSARGPGLKKLQGGRIINVNPNKVPRIIGKQGSMVSMIKDATGCRIVVGQNGVVWIDGLPEGELIAVEAIAMIEEKSHLTGLTDKVKAFLEKKTKKKIEIKEIQGVENDIHKEN